MFKLFLITRPRNFFIFDRSEKMGKTKKEKELQ